MSKLFTVNMVNIKSALMFALLIAVIEVLVYVIGVGDVFALDFKAVVNALVFPFLGAVLSLLKSFLTTSGGKFAGIVQVK